MKTIKKITPLVLTATVITSFSAVGISANAAENNKVRVIVSNDVFSKADGAAWEGTLVDEWVDIDENSTMLSSVVKALENNGYTQTGADSGYFSEINGLSASDCQMGGWMGTLNDWFTNELFGCYTVANGTLEAGDEINLQYTMSYGVDIGSDWSDNTTALAYAEFSVGTLSPEFDPEVTDYTLTVPSDTKSVAVTPTAFNKNYQVRTYKNEYTPAEDGTEYKRNSDISVVDGDKIIIGVGSDKWPSMNYSAGGTEYTFTVDFEQDKTAEAVSEKLKSTSDCLLTLSTPSVGSVGGEWSVLGLARNNTISESFANGYYENLENYVKEKGSSTLSKNKSTDNSRVILALSAIGKDARNVAGYNLLEPYADFEYVTWQGINGPVFALIALDTYGYDIPTDSSVSEQTTREKLVDYILENALEDGGWAFFGKNADPDMTGMAIQALAPYYNTDEAVKTVVDKAVGVLSDMQNSNGGFASWGTVNSESCAQVVTALASIGVNPDKDSRFVKDGGSAVDALLSFGCENGFKHTADGSYNQMATEQGFYALVAYNRFTNGNNSLYNMTDASPYSVKYDIDGNGCVGVSDATIIQKYLADTAELSSTQLARADVDKDGSVTVTDATFIQKQLAK